MEKAEVLFERVKAFSHDHPEWIYLIIGISCLMLFIGVVKDKNWAIDPSSGNQRFFYNLFGRKAFRFIAGVAFLLGSAAGFASFLFHHFNSTASRLLNP